MEESLNPIVKKGLMAPISDRERVGLYQRHIGSQNQSNGLAPTSSSPAIQNRLPIAGFQGTPAFPNPGGGFVDRTGLAPLSGVPSQMPQPLDATGQIPQNYQIPRRPDFSLLAQGQPQGGGFNTIAQFGADGQLTSLLLKRALARKAGLV